MFGGGVRAAGDVFWESGGGGAEWEVAVWSPHALGRLAENVAAGKCGPGMTIEELDGKILVPA